MKPLQSSHVCKEWNPYKTLTLMKDKQQRIPSMVMSSCHVQLAPVL